MTGMSFLANGTFAAQSVARSAGSHLPDLARLETTATLRDFLTITITPVRFQRDGLGEWLGVALPVPDGFLLIAVPSHQTDFGCSIWYPASSDAAQIAGQVLGLLNDPTKARLTRFMTPDGDPIEPALNP